MTSVSACPWNINGWIRLQFKCEVSCPPLYEECWGRQKKYSGSSHLIKSSSVPQLFLLVFLQSVETLQDIYMPQDQIALFLYCFIITLLIYIGKEQLVFFIEKHQLFVIVLTLLYLTKNLWNYLLALSSSSPISAFTEIPDRNPQCSDVRMKDTLWEGLAIWYESLVFFSGTSLLGNSSCLPGALSAL